MIMIVRSGIATNRNELKRIGTNRNGLERIGTNRTESHLDQIIIPEFELKEKRKLPELPELRELPQLLELPKRNVALATVI